MSETKGEFPEPTIRSLKNILYRYMEENAYKYIHKLTQFVTTLNFGWNCSTYLMPKNVKNSDFLSTLHSKPIREFRKPNFESGDRVRISKYDLPFRKGYKPQFTEEVLENVAISSRKPPTYTTKDEQDDIIRGKFYQKDKCHLIMELLKIGLVWNASAQLFPDNTLSSFTKFLPEQLNLDGQWEVAISEKSYPSMYQNVTEGEIIIFDKKLSKSSEFDYWELGLYLSFTDIVEAMNILIHERHNHTKNFIKFKVSRRTPKVEIYLANEGSSLAFLSTDLGHFIGSNIGNGFGVKSRGKGPHKPQFA